MKSVVVNGCTVDQAATAMVSSIHTYRFIYELAACVSANYLFPSLSLSLSLSLILSLDVAVNWSHFCLSKDDADAWGWEREWEGALIIRV